MPTKCHDFKLEVTTGGESDVDADLMRYYGYVTSTKNALGSVFVYEGNWQAMKYLAQTLEKKHGLDPALTYQGKWAKYPFGVL